MRRNSRVSGALSEHIIIPCTPERNTSLDIRYTVNFKKVKFRRLRTYVTLKPWNAIQNYVPIRSGVIDGEMEWCS